LTAYLRSAGDGPRIIAEIEAFRHPIQLEALDG
jgi:hypothetical protein